MLSYPQVILEAQIEEACIMYKVMDGEEFHRGDAEVGQVSGHGRMSEAGVRTTDFFGNLGVAFGETLHMGLVDHTFFEGDVEA